MIKLPTGLSKDISPSGELSITIRLYTDPDFLTASSLSLTLELRVFCEFAFDSNSAALFHGSSRFLARRSSKSIDRVLLVFGAVGVTCSVSDDLSPKLMNHFSRIQRDCMLSLTDNFLRQR